MVMNASSKFASVVATFTLMLGDLCLAAEERWEIAKQMEEIAKDVIVDINFLYEEHRNECAEDAQIFTIDWIKKFNIISNDESIKKINAAAFAKLIANAHYKSNLKITSIIADFATWLFIYDDIIEKQQDQNAIENLHARILAILNGEKVTNDDGAITQGFGNIIERLNNVCKEDTWKVRFIKDVKEYCDSTIWEFKNRQEKQVPSLLEFQQNRPNTSGTKVMFDFIELAEDIIISQDIFEHKYFKTIRLLGAKIVNTENDIISAAKEYLAGDYHNLVFVYKKASDQIDYQEAFNRTLLYLSCDILSFMDLAENIPDFGVNMNGVETYINGIKNWISAHHFWAMTSTRYKISKK
jgi:5-epi-alpha-selinene synthase